jgi:hypothetical protein
VQDEAYWRKRLEELGVKFDEVVVEVLRLARKHSENPYEPVINSISQYIYDVVSKLHSLTELLNSSLDNGMSRDATLHALAKLEDIAFDIECFVKNTLKVLPR